MESYIHERFFYDDTVLKESADESTAAYSGESAKVLTETIRMMVQTISAGSNFIKPKLKETNWSLQRRDDEVRKKWMSIKIAAAEGAGTEQAVFSLALLTFRCCSALKLNFYSMQQHCTDLIRAIKKSAFYPSRFQLAFSSDEHRKEIWKAIETWDTKKKIIWTGKVPNRVPRLYRFSENASARTDNRCPSRRICELSITAKTWRSNDELLSYAIVE